jgi:hypothetical protein
MSKLQNLQQALKTSAGKAAIESPAPVRTTDDSPKPAPARRTKAPSREGKDYTGAWLNPDFGTSLRLVQIRKRKDPQGKKVYLDDIIAEALNDLFIKYDVPTVLHE